MRTIIESEDQAIGRTVESVDIGGGEYAAVHFTDGSSLLFVAHGDADYCDVEVSGKMPPPAEARYVGVMTKEEADAAIAAEHAKWLAGREQFDREQYERLRQRFESATADPARPCPHESPVSVGSAPESLSSSLLPVPEEPQP